MKRFSSLRARIVLLILLGADVPLALAGWWLSQSAVRSAEQLLLAQLDTSVATIATKVEESWSYRRGDLLFLAGNDVVERALLGQRLTSPDSAYFSRLCTDVRAAIPQVSIRAPAGVPVLECREQQSPAPGPRVRLQVTTPALREDRMAMIVPITGEDEAILGRLEAEVRVGALLPRDSLPILVRNARFTVTERENGRLLIPSGGVGPPSNTERFSVEGEPWIAAHRSVVDPPIDLAVAAPMNGYVAPFMRAARIGWLVFAGVTLLTLVLATYFSRRMTHSLQQLVLAADAVAAGDLQRNVETNGAEEVGRLGRSFNTMTESLRSTLQELSNKRAMAAVGEFAASLSHEVRNALTAVRLDLQRVEELVPGAAVHGQLVTRALVNVKRLDNAVTGSLAVARSGRDTFETLDLRTVVNAATGTVRDAFDVAGVELESRLDVDRSTLLRGDAVALEQMFVNLLLNAAQASAPNTKVRMHVEVNGATCAVIISDSGPGMTAEQLSRVGKPFRSSKAGGTGLGLVIASRIATSHGGSLQLQNPAGQGVVARITLPLGQEILRKRGQTRFNQIAGKQRG